MQFFKQQLLALKQIIARDEPVEQEATLAIPCIHLWISHFDDEPVGMRVCIKLTICMAHLEKDGAQPSGTTLAIAIYDLFIVFASGSNG